MARRDRDGPDASRLATLTIATTGENVVEHIAPVDLRGAVVQAKSHRSGGFSRWWRLSEP